MQVIPTTTAAVSSAKDSVSMPAKRFVRRLLPDRSQAVRHCVQAVFLALNAWIAIEFVIWVRFFESQGRTPFIERPAGVDGWLPIAGLMNLKYFLMSSQMPEIHPSAMVLAAVFLLSSLFIKKVFCSWLCPVGTISEYLWKLGRKLFRNSLILPRWLDLPLRSLKYLLMGFFLILVLSMSAESIHDFMLAPFGIVADVKMLNFFRNLGLIGVVVLASLILLSVVIQNFWCRFLCPYGALMGIVSTLSPVRIRRDTTACIDCGKCAKACPSHLPVDQLIQIQSLECTSCMECVAACPASHALQLALAPHALATDNHTVSAPTIERWRGRVLKPHAIVAALALIFFGLIGLARATGHWQTTISPDVYRQMVPHANEYEH